MDYLVNGVGLLLYRFPQFMLHFFMLFCLSDFELYILKKKLEYIFLEVLDQDFQNKIFGTKYLECKFWNRIF